MTAPELRERADLEADLQVAYGLARLAVQVADVRMVHCRRLRQSHSRFRCLGAADLVRAAQALDDAHRAWRIAEDACRACGRLIDLLRGDGLSTLEARIQRELGDLRQDLDSTSRADRMAD